MLDAQNTTPLIHDGVMYVTSSHGRTFAVDAKTGSMIWQYNASVAGRCRQKHVLRHRQSWRSALRGQGLCGHARRPCRCARHEDRQAGVGRRPRRLQERLHHDRRAADCEGQGDRRHLGRGIPDAAVHRSARRRNRQTSLAPLHDSCAGRTGIRHLGLRSGQSQIRRRIRLDHGFIRSGAQYHLLGHRQSEPRLGRRRPRGRQPLLQFHPCT